METSEETWVFTWRRTRYAAEEDLSVISFQVYVESVEKVCTHQPEAAHPFIQCIHSTYPTLQQRHLGHDQTRHRFYGDLSSPPSTVYSWCPLARPHLQQGFVLPHRCNTSRRNHHQCPMAPLRPHSKARPANTSTAGNA